MTSLQRLDALFTAGGRFDQLERQVKDLHGGGGGGTSGGMEDRVRRIETTVDQLGRDVTELRVNLATITERVAHLPSKGFIVTAASTIIVLLTAATVFADKLRALL